MLTCRLVWFCKNPQNDRSQSNRPMLSFRASRKDFRSVEKPIDGVGLREYISFGTPFAGLPAPQGSGLRNLVETSPLALRLFCVR